MGSTHIEQLQKELRRSKGGIDGYITFLEKTISDMKGIEEYQSFLRSEIEAGGHQEPPRTGEAVRWQAPMKRFLNAFQNIDWEAIRHQSGLLDWYELIIGLLMGKDTMCWLPHAHYNLHEGSDKGTYTGIIGGARKYAFHTLSYRTDTLLACRIQNFQRFIFVSYCAVLIDLEAKHDEVHDIMRICVSDTSSKNLDRYISGARLINKWMDILLRRGWGFRSWEIFLFCRHSLAKYGAFSDYRQETTKAFEEYLEHSGTKLPDIEKPDRVPLCIPLIIHYISGKSMGLTDISRRLGYSDDSIKKIRNIRTSQGTQIDALLAPPTEIDQIQPNQPFLV